MIDLASIAALLEHYGYAIMIPLAIVEGPIVTIIGGFLVSLGIFNPLIVFLIVLFGDFIGDSGLYALGRWGGEFFFTTIGPRIGITEARFEKARAYFETRGEKAVMLSKYIHGIGIAGLVAAGSMRIPYGKYIFTCFFATLMQSTLFLALGIFFGHAYVRISGYLNHFAGAASIIVLAGFALFFLYRKLHIKRG